MKCRTYRVHYIATLGFVVYRHLFDEKQCNFEEGVRAHKQAVFVDGGSATDYCGYCNQMTDANGSDSLWHRTRLRKKLFRLLAGIGGELP